MSQAGVHIFILNFAPFVYARMQKKKGLFSRTLSIIFFSYVLTPNCMLQILTYLTLLSISICAHLLRIS